MGARLLSVGKKKGGHRGPPLRGIMYNPEIHHRRSIRLRDFDYSSAGAYFVTVCVQNRECLFGRLVADRIDLNMVGEMIRETWLQIPQRYPGTNVDVHVTMPNHFHGIIYINVGAPPCGCPSLGLSGKGHPQGGAPTLSLSKDARPREADPTLSLPDIVHRFKSLATARYRDGVLRNNWTPYPGRLWQRNYYEHVIRNEGDLNHIRQYIADNPLKWDSDENNPLNQKSL